MTDTSNAAGLFDRTEVGRIGVGKDDAGAPLYSGNGHRFARVQVGFRRAFHHQPNVTVSIAGADIERHGNWRLRAYPENVTPQGFTIVFETWSDTVIWFAEASWVATGA